MTCFVVSNQSFALFAHYSVFLFWTCEDAIDRIVASGDTVYGVNTGFGLLASTRIPDERLAELQTNLILSHSAGLGDPLPRHVTRLMIVLKLLGLGRGYSGVRPLVIEALRTLNGVPHQGVLTTE